MAQAWFRKNTDVPNHVWEQTIWRRNQVKEKSPECWEKGYCTVCGCDIIGKTYEDRACSKEELNEEPCYPAMMDKETWKEYKKSNNIKLFD